MSPGPDRTNTFPTAVGSQRPPSRHSRTLGDVTLRAYHHERDRRRVMSIDFTPDPQLYPFESRWFDSSRGRIHYVDEGTGPPILLCHGNPTWSFLYRDIIVALRDRFRCVAPDYLGFGLSGVLGIRVPDRRARAGDRRIRRSPGPGPLPEHGSGLGWPDQHGGRCRACRPGPRRRVGQHVVLAGGHAGDEGLQQGDVQPASAVRDLTAQLLCRALDTRGNRAPAE